MQRPRIVPGIPGVRKVGRFYLTLETVKFLKSLDKRANKGRK